MEINISKFHGAGNDFLITHTNERLELSKDVIALLCNRHLGVGADGLILMQLSTDCDFNMVFYNSDGNEAEMCGNGARCATAWANEHGWLSKNVFTASDGIHNAYVLQNSENLWQIEVSLNISSNIKKLSDGSFFVNTGVPHNVRIVDDINDIDVYNEGKKYRTDAMFLPNGANINFLSIGNNINLIRTYERGVEAETLACGTGCAASALILNKFFQQKFPISLVAEGGTLTVDVRNDVLYLSGPAKKVFEVLIDSAKL